VYNRARAFDTADRHQARAPSAWHVPAYILVMVAGPFPVFILLSDARVVFCVFILFIAWVIWTFSFDIILHSRLSCPCAWLGAVM
jgi:hypothetical protein